MNWAILGTSAHVAGALPLAVCGGALMARRPVAPAALLLSVAFAFSVIADTVALLLLRAGEPNIWITYTLVPVQMTLIVLALGRLRWERMVILFFVLTLVTSYAVSDFRSQEAIASIHAGALVCLLAFRNDVVRQWRGPVMVYTGAAIPFLLVMGSSPPPENPLWIPAWAGYQVVRITALAWMSWLVFRSARPKQLEVT